VVRKRTFNFCFAFAVLFVVGRARADEAALVRLREALPRSASECDGDRLSRVAKAAGRLDQWAASLAEFRQNSPVTELLRRVESLAAVQGEVDQHVGRFLDLRGQFAALPDDPRRRDLVRSFLSIATRMVDLSGRLRHASVDVIDNVAVALSADLGDLARLVDLLHRHESAVGAAVMAPFLVDPPRNNAEGLQPIPVSLKLAILRLVAQTGAVQTLPTIAGIARAPDARPEIVIAAAETIRALGVPQDPLADQDPALPKPAITAGELYTIVSRLRIVRRRDEVARRRADLLASLDVLRQKGLSEDEYRLGRHIIRPGDWLLMRNPSPYNLFSDLSPGLFTHVGVVTAITAADGKRRLVVVDLPERGTQIPATNVDLFVQRTLNYVILRHTDPRAAAKMATVAASVIGNESQFDLNFRTERVAALAGRPLAGAKINTYCAGLLLLCAQETEHRRDTFFPLPDRCAGGRTKENLARLGVSIPDGFLSPTGPLFSSQFAIAARRPPMYSPAREIEQAVFDHFAEGLQDRSLSGSWDEYQALRIKLAESARKSPLLAKALARAAGVNEEMDLVSAAKTAAIVETLDEVAFSASRRFAAAWEAFMRPQANLPASDDIKKRHPELWQKRQGGAITLGDLRRSLIAFYTDEGQSEVDRRLFSHGSK
jgi:hypothetical protein